MNRCAVGIPKVSSYYNMYSQYELSFAYLRDKTIRIVL